MRPDDCRIVPPVRFTGLGLGSAPGILDHDNLATTVLTAVRANVMRPLQLAAIAALDEVHFGNEMVAASVSLVCAADPLFWKCAHDAVLLSRPRRVVFHSLIGRKLGEPRHRSSVLPGAAHGRVVVRQQVCQLGEPLIWPTLGIRRAKQWPGTIRSAVRLHRDREQNPLPERLGDVYLVIVTDGKTRFFILTGSIELVALGGQVHPGPHVNRLPEWFRERFHEGMVVLPEADRAFERNNPCHLGVCQNVGLEADEPRCRGDIPRCQIVIERKGLQRDPNVPGTADGFKEQRSNIESRIVDQVDHPILFRCHDVQTYPFVRTPFAFCDETMRTNTPGANPA